MKMLKTLQAVISRIPLERLRRNMTAQLLVAFSVVLLYAGCAFAAQTAAGTLTYMQGTVSVMKETKRGVFIDAHVGDMLTEGDIIKTAKAAKAEVSLGDGSVIHIAANSQMQLKQYMVNRETAERNIVVSATEGKLRFVVSKVVKAAATAESKWKTSNFTVETPTAVAGIMGTDFVVTVSRGHTNVAVFEGYVKIGNVSYLIKGTITLSANQASTVKKDEKPKEATIVTEAQKNLLQLETTQQVQAKAEEGVAPTVDEAAQIKAALQAVIDEIAKGKEGEKPEDIIAAALDAGLSINQTMVATITQGVSLPEKIALLNGVSYEDMIGTLISSGETFKNIALAMKGAGIADSEILRAAKNAGVVEEEIKGFSDAAILSVEASPGGP